MFGVFATAIPSMNNNGMIFKLIAVRPLLILQHLNFWINVYFRFWASQNLTF